MKGLENSQDSLGASSVALELAFEKWIGTTDFVNLIQILMNAIIEKRTENFCKHSFQKD